MVVDQFFTELADELAAYPSLLVRLLQTALVARGAGVVMAVDPMAHAHA